MMGRKVGEAAASASYLIDAISNKPVAALAALASTPIAMSLFASFQGALTPYLFLLGLCAIDFYTAIRACRILGEKVTSSIMREKGLPKLHDYSIAVATGALASGAMNSIWWTYGIVGFLVSWEVYSILGENLRRTSTRQFDWRRIPVLRAIAPLIAGARKDATPEEIAQMPADIPGGGSGFIVDTVMPSSDPQGDSERG